MQGLSVLTWSGEVSVVQDQVQMMRSDSPLLTTLLHLASPFTLTYTCTALTLVSNTVCASVSIMLYYLLYIVVGYYIDNSRFS